MYRTFIKRFLDLCLALVGIVMASPILIIIAILIKTDSPGPVFYRGVRVGKDNKDFRMYKFRTMVVDADKVGASSTPDDDPRITRVGKTLRRYKLDELPQLINILAGHMSFVGPRPQVRWAVERYSDEEKQILQLRPGITDYASLQFSNEGEILRGSTDPDKDYFEKIHPEKMRLSLQYLEEVSLRTDLKILGMTIRKVVLGN
ncbi:MAG: sugar transferase [Cytophagales bacterium]|nr:sugar transferase [Cytophagales bacterium]